MASWGPILSRPDRVAKAEQVPPPHFLREGNRRRSWEVLHLQELEPVNSLRKSLWARNLALASEVLGLETQFHNTLKRRH